MIKRCKFIVALVLCLCVFAYDTVNIFGDWGGRSIAWATDPTFSGNALELSAQLGLYFYLKDVVEGDTTKYGTMTFKIGDKEIDSVVFSDTTQTKEGGDIETQTDTENGQIHGFRCDVNAIQMADKITATYKYTQNGTEETVTNSTGINSVKAYLEKILEASDINTKPKLATLVKAIQDYGHYAQVTLNDTNSSYGTHATMEKSSNAKIKNTDITDDTTVPITGQETNSDSNLSTYAISVKGGTGVNLTDEDVKKVSFTLDLDSNIALHVYIPSDFFKDSATYSSATATVQKVTETTNNKQITRSAYADAGNATMTPSTDTISNKTYQVFSFSNIPAHEIDNKYTITVTDSASKTYTIVVSPLSYVYAVTKLTYTADMKTSMGLDSDTELDHLKQAVIAFYNYYKATIAYRTSTEYNAQ